jgi:hypothetical protein
MCLIDLILDVCLGNRSNAYFDAISGIFVVVMCVCIAGMRSRISLKVNKLHE